MTSADSDAWHVPVLAQEALEALLVDPKGLYVDLTAGGGGHSSLILEKLETGGRLLAADRDGEAIIESEKRLAAVKTKGTYQVIQATFSDFPHWLAADDRGFVKGLMADLGVSSRQFDRGERGFSYLHDGPLDMRMNMESGQSAAELLAGISQTGLAALLRLYGEERYAASLAAAIVARRRKAPITRPWSWRRSWPQLSLPGNGGRGILPAKPSRPSAWPSIRNRKSWPISWTSYPRSWPRAAGWLLSAFIRWKTG